MKEARILYGSTMFGSPGFSGDMLWKTKCLLPDQEFLVEIGGRSYLFVSPLEFNRARKEAKVDEVINLDSYQEEKKIESSKTISIISHFLKEYGVSEITLSSSFPFEATKLLQEQFTVGLYEGNFYPERMHKTEEEIGFLHDAQRTTEEAFQDVKEFLESCYIKGKFIYKERYSDPITSENVKGVIEDGLYDYQYLALNTIVASGLQTANPHDTGSGVLLARSPIIVDIFPVSLESHYWGDMTRTFFKGEPSKEIQHMYSVVLEGQTAGISMVRSGVDGFDVWDFIIKMFEERGYPTNFKEARGFFHSVGHGVGLELHENLRIANNHLCLEEGYVVTIEPGLYYPEAQGNIPAGGIRIEDMVVVEKDGCRNLNTFPKDLESMIL